MKMGEVISGKRNSVNYSMKENAGSVWGLAGQAADLRMNGWDHPGHSRWTVTAVWLR